MNKTFLAIASILVITTFGFITSNSLVMFSSYEDYRSSMAGGGSTIEGLPEGENSLFAGSGKCGGCHGFDPTGVAGVDLGGNDVNLVDDWRASMMANAAKDPFWRAKVSHEVAVNPEHQEALEDKCLSCHAPQARHAAIHDGAMSYSMQEMLVDSLALDGVSCGACHQQRPETVGDFFSGEMSFDNDSVYGPYGNGEDADIFASPMQGLIGFTPLYGEYIENSEACAACHTLITNTVDLEGNFTGGEFVEQATYHEWLNSQYNTDQVECQSCHMPRIEDPIVLSTNYIFLEGRTPFGLHTMVGGNSFMLEMLKNHIEETGAAATEQQFQDAIDATINQLQNETVDLELSQIAIAEDTAKFEVALTNQVGHKFPSGYPARRAYIEFVVLDDLLDTLFQSGVLQDNYEVFGQNDTYEPHYDKISSEEDVQIYELVMGDVNDDVTTVLERADHNIKDNRLVPAGFSYDHPTFADTVSVSGNALSDDDFNNNGTVGSGTDWIEYHIPLNGYEGEITVKASLYYQSVPPKWNEEMFAISTPEIDLFEEWYWEQGAAPVLIDNQELLTTTIGLEELELNQLTFSPNPTSDGFVFVTATLQKIDSYSIYDIQGKLIDQKQVLSKNCRIELPIEKGIYMIQIDAGNKSTIEKVIRY